VVRRDFSQAEIAESRDDVPIQPIPGAGVSAALPSLGAALRPLLKVREVALDGLRQSDGQALLRAAFLGGVDAGG
jgi:hypothetical protein